MSGFHDRPSSVPRLWLARIGTAFLATAAMIAPALPGASAQSLSADPMLSAEIKPVDELLTATGEPGPHRVPGHYFTSPTAPAEQLDIAPRVLVGPSTPVVVGTSVCTLAVTGVDRDGHKVGITAGHCGKAGDPVASLDLESAGRIGTFVRSGSPDYGVITFHDDVQLTRSYNNVTINQLGGAQPVFGEQLCKTGVTTGTKCGPFLTVSDGFLVSHICASIGDSGGPLYRDERLVGIVNGGLGALPSCHTPVQGPVHAPLAGLSWEVLAADLDRVGGVGAGFVLPG